MKILFFVSLNKKLEGKRHFAISCRKARSHEVNFNLDKVLHQAAAKRDIKYYAKLALSISRNTQQAEPDLNSIRVRNVSCNLGRKMVLYLTDHKDDFSLLKNKKTWIMRKVLLHKLEFNNCMFAENKTTIV